MGEIEFAYHWSREYPWRKVHLSVDSDAETALCGRDVSDIDIVDVGPLQFVFFDTAVSGSIFNLLPICTQCYRRAKALTED